jgi:hypothetical protein
MERTTREERDNKNNSTVDSEEPRLSSANTFEAEIKFVSSEEDLAAQDTKQNNSNLLLCCHYDPSGK